MHNLGIVWIYDLHISTYTMDIVWLQCTFTKPYPGYSLGTIYICQTLSNVRTGYGLAVTPDLIKAT